MSNVTLTLCLAAYFSAGGCVRRFAAGTSGERSRSAAARKAGRAGNARRYGIAGVAMARRAAVRAGDIGLVEARAETVWRALSAGSASTARDLADHLGLSLRQIGSVLRLLARAGYIRREQGRVFVSPGVAPDWRVYPSSRPEGRVPC